MLYCEAKATEGSIWQNSKHMNESSSQLRYRKSKCTRVHVLNNIGQQLYMQTKGQNVTATSNRHETNHVEDNSQSKQVQTTGSNSTIPKHPKYIDQQILANTQVPENFPIHIQFKSKNHNFHFKNHVYPDQFRLCIWIREL